MAPLRTRISIHPGDNANIPKQRKYRFWCHLGECSFLSVSVISPIDSRISLVAGQTASSAVLGSLSLLRKPLLCKWSFMPANTIVIGFISVCRWTPIATDTDCIKSKSIAAIIITSDQKRTWSSLPPKSWPSSSLIYRTPQR